jgi:cyclopropane-fatty-acyl-phospholipid synthase
MLEKALLNQVFRLIKVGSLKVTYWTGETVTFGSGQLYAHITVHNPKAIRAMAKAPTLGFGESYMNGDIDVDGDLQMVNKLIIDNPDIPKRLAKLKAVTPHSRYRNNKSTQAKQIQHHYDLGNDFYKRWLDESMTYSCAYFKTPKDSLEKAQEQKLDHVLAKLQLKPGMSLLDIGSGWGQLLIRAAQKHGVTGHGITLSKEQYKHSKALAKKLGLADKLTFELINYQDLAERGLVFDRVVSVGMFEHVGRGNHEAYFTAVDKMLKPGGITVLHTISGQHPDGTDPWIDRYIFPGGYLPTVAEVTHISPRYNLQLLDYENLRIHYAMTLHEWLRRYEEHAVWVLKHYDERFYRMWRMYLAVCEAGFRWGDLGLSQFVFSKGVNNDLPLTRDFLYRAEAPRRQQRGPAKAGRPAA